MASKLQKRLVGTLVLVSIGVIFLPDVLDGKKEHYQESYQSIPLRDDFDASVAETPIAEPQVADVAVPDTSVKTTDEEGGASNQRETPPDSKASESIATVDGAWMIRLGTFRNQDNARRLVSQLREKGYQAHILPRDLKPNDLAKVVVGPDVSKNTLESQLADLESLTGLKGQLRKFDPLTQ